MEMWKTLRVSHISTPPTATTNYGLKRRYTNIPLGTKSRSGQDHSQGPDILTIFRQLGTALVATIVGLPFRQALFAYAPGQQDQDTFYRNLEEELRRSASEFRKSQ